MRVSPFRALLAALVLGLTVGSVGLTSAQESTPSADPLAGVTVEALGGQAPAATPDRTLVLLRITMEPGVEIIEHGHPGAVVLFVVDGTFGTTFLQGAGVVARATTAGTPAETYDVEAGEAYILNPGDTVAYDEGAHHVMRNEGDTPLVLLATGLLTTDQPGFLFATQ